MISEEKKKIVIRNYFKIDCGADTTAREAYELGFNRGIQKATPVIRGDVLEQVSENIHKELCEFIDFVCNGMQNKKDEETVRVLLTMAMGRAEGMVAELKEAIT